MRRIFGDYAYGEGPRDGCWWDHSAQPQSFPKTSDTIKADVCVIGAGYTGLNAALTLAECGATVVVIDARYPGWGASGRNGGFCCIGGSKITQDQLERRFGLKAAMAYREAEVSAVTHVSDLIERFGWDVDRHSKGETVLAHSNRAMCQLEASARDIERLYGCEPNLHDTTALRAIGMGGDFHGGLTIPIGFGLNPRKYVDGLITAALDAGVQIFAQSPAFKITKTGAHHIVHTGPGGEVHAPNVVLGLNGYADEGLNRWLRARYMPAQSTVLVTRPLTQTELDAQGWTSDQMAYDSRNLLHYFRLMPDRRFLFGLRGGLFSSPSAEGRARRAARKDFERMFPFWSHVESEHSWSGMVCLTSKALPYCGPIPGNSGLWTAFAYHGNGVAMGSFLGHRLGQLMSGQTAGDDIPEPVCSDTPRWPLGRFRRAIMPPIYWALALADR